MLVVFSLFVILLYAQDVPPPKPKPKTDSSSSSGKSTKATPAVASLLIVPDVACKVMIDDRDLGTLLPGHPKPVRVDLGDHLVHAHALSGQGTWQDTISVEKPVQIIVKIGIKDALAREEALAAQKAAEQRQAEAREAQEAAQARKALEALPAFEGNWRYTEGLTTWTLSMRVENGKLAGSIVHAYHRDAKYHEARCTTPAQPAFCSSVSPEYWSGPCLPQTTCTQARTTPGKDWTIYWALEGRAEQDARVRISGQYQRCVGDCDPVSNPHAMDIGDQGMELRDSKLYWADMQFTHQ